MLPGFFLALLYLVYVIGWALIDPKIAPKLPPELLKVPIPAPVAFLRDHYSTNFLVATLKAAFAPSPLLNAPGGARITYGRIIKNLISALFPLIMTVALIAGTWWYVVIHPKAQFDEAQAVLVLAKPLPGPTNSAPAKAQEETLVEIGAESTSSSRSSSNSGGGLVALDADPDNADSQKADVYTPPSDNFYLYFGITSFLTLLLLINYYRKLRDEQFEILKLLVESVMPLGILTVVVLAVILLGITTATESAAIGAAGAFLLAWSSGSFTFERMKQAVFLTTKTTSMVCWLFVGSALFSAVFAILGGQQIIESWVLGMNLSPLQFMLLSQALIFVLGWPLEWTEIIVIFVPIFLPMLSHFNIDPILWGTLVFVNLQAAFLSPPVAMSAFYLKGVAPPHVTLNQIFAGMMPYMFIVIICMAIMYVWPGMTLWLPKYLYGGG
jgi:TRAP-type mannitol/chloroaromatic compound transport system permease large subunit